MIHLHTKSCWSLLESSLRIEDIIQASLEQHSSYAVLTDTNTMFGTMAFLHACAKAGLKPIVGLEVHVLDPFDVHLLLLAKNNQGLQNLYGLSSLIMTRTQKSVSLEELVPFASNCIVLTGGQDEIFLSWSEQGLLESLNDVLSTLDEALEDFYVSMAMHDASRFQEADRALKSVALQLGIPTVALSRVDYRYEQDVRKVQMLQAIEKQTHMKDPDLMVRFGRYWRSEEEMAALYDPEDLAATEEIAGKIELDSLHLPKSELPVFQNKLQISSQEYLRRLCQKGLAARLQGKKVPEYEERLEKELAIINGMGFADYFLIVWDFIREARSRKILVGPGRGSAAGSIAAWSIGITHVDPVANGLLFERFLNPDRVTMPDIDTDIPDDRRDEVIAYVAKRYGDQHVAHIVTFSTFKAKMALRDAGRVLHVNAYDINQLCKLAGNRLDLTLEKAWDNPAFRRMVQSKPALMELYQAARDIEGLPRHASVHAGGIVFSRRPVTQTAPVLDVGFSIPAVQFTMDHLEELGLIKFDFLGLKNLSLIDAMNRMIAATCGRPLDLFKLPLDDPRVYRLLKTGQTLGIFQLESAGIRQLILQLQPDNFMDIAAVLALYRPGPMQNIGMYLEARKRKQATVLHPLLEELLQETGGIFLYQEQIMMAAQTIGGFSLAQADSLRKAMSKKKREEMESWQALFLEGASKKEIPQEQARHIFEVMERFADYGFNKSHSYAYGLVVYWMAYIKANYPLQFYVCALQSVVGDKGKTAEYLQECRLRHIPLYLLDVNASRAEYILENQGIRLPLSLIKSTGGSMAARIEAEREARGPFRDIYEAIARLQAAGLNEKQLESLIWAGGLDRFGFGRQALHQQLERLIQYGQLIKVEQEDFLLNFDIASPPLLSSQPDERMVVLEEEYKTLGLYLSEHPAVSLRRQFPGAISTQKAKDLQGRVMVTGRIASIHTHKTKTGAMMAFLSLEDESGSIDVAVMPQLYASWQLNLQKDVLLGLEGWRERSQSIRATRFYLPPSSF